MELPKGYIFMKKMLNTTTQRLLLVGYEEIMNRLLDVERENHS
jgi:hypothetical protein